MFQVGTRRVYGDTTVYASLLKPRAGRNGRDLTVAYFPEQRAEALNTVAEALNRVVAAADGYRSGAVTAEEAASALVETRDLLDTIEYIPL